MQYLYLQSSSSDLILCSFFTVNHTNTVKYLLDHVLPSRGEQLNQHKDSNRRINKNESQNENQEQNENETQNKESNGKDLQNKVNFENRSQKTTENHSQDQTQSENQNVLFNDEITEEEIHAAISKLFNKLVHKIFCQWFSTT